MSDLDKTVNDNGVEEKQDNNTQVQVIAKKKMPLGWKIFLLVIVACYIYLIIPVTLYWNVMGIEIGMRVHYQPLTTCLHGTITTSMFGGAERDMTRCGVSPIEFLQIKHDLGKSQKMPFSLYDE